MQFDESLDDTMSLEIPVSSRITKYVATNWLELACTPCEFHDINMTWSNYWREYLDRVGAQTMHGLARFHTYFLKILEDYTRCSMWRAASFPLPFQKEEKEMYSETAPSQDAIAIRIA